MDSSQWSAAQLVDLTKRITRTTVYCAASGGFHDVWHCIWDTGANQIMVAVKATRHPEFINENELRRELGIWQRLHHANILPLLGITEGFGPYISTVSPWMKNGSLTVYLGNHKDITMSDRLCLLQDIACGLHYLHGVLVLHVSEPFFWDLTPFPQSNVLLNDQKMAVLADFTLSSMLVDQGHSYLQRSIARPGSIRYSAPELLNADVFIQPDTRSDIYSFGCLALQVLSGYKPWADVKDLLSIVYKVTHGETPQIPADSRISDAQQHLIQRCFLPLSASPPRPSTDAILTFLKKELKLEGKKAVIPSTGHSNEDEVAAFSQDIALNHHLDIDPNSVIKQSSYQTASGGLGDVYRCLLNRESSQEEVVVKCLRLPSLSELDIDKINHNLHRKIIIWAQLKHQYILSLYGTVTGFGPFPTLVSPWMSNGMLTSYLCCEGVSLTMMGRLHILKQITEGLKYLHGKDVIHGDLTGNNVLVAADGSPHLADFGIFNVVVAFNPTFFYRTGAIRWAAPELIILPEGQTIQYATKQSDIYSLGCIMLQVLYEKVPYWWIHSAPRVVMLKFKNQEPIDNTMDIQVHHLNFMRRCWSTNSESRPSVEEVLDFLEEAISHEAVST